MYIEPAFTEVPARRRVVINLKKKIFLPTIFALSVLVVGILAASNTYAQETTTYPPIVQKIAEKFNLNVSDVEEVFDEERDERHADMYAKFAEKLNDLVTDGKLTEAQKDTILEKHEAMQDKMEELKGVSSDERREKMQAFHEEFRTWAQSEGLDLSPIGPFGKGFMHGFGRGNMMRPNN